MKTIYIVTWIEAGYYHFDKFYILKRAKEQYNELLECKVKRKYPIRNLYLSKVII